MKRSETRMARLVRHWYNSRLAVIFESLIIGLITGLVVVLFRILLNHADVLRRRLYGALPELPLYWTLLWIFGLIAGGLFLGWAAKLRPMIKGSGIPQIKGALNRRMTLDWGPELPLKLITGTLGLGAGLSLGREGPSIQIGAYVGKGVLSIFHRPRRERKILIAAASAAGLAAAFNAPLAGVLFVLEELQSQSSPPQEAGSSEGAFFPPLFLACAMGASITADAAASYFFGLRPVFDFNSVTVLPLSAFFWVTLLGVLCGLAGDLFKRSLYCSLNLYDRFPVSQIFKPLIPLLVSVPLGFFLFDLIGGGHGLIESLSVTERSLGMLAVLLAGKILFTALCYGSGTAGGIFLPLLACGALAGDLLGHLLIRGGFIAAGQNLNFMILGMAAFFAAVVKAPVTGMVLILEMSGNFNHLGGLVLVCLSAFVTTELIASPPVYAVLLERMLKSGPPAVKGCQLG
ncbi:MAG: ClC family H(+)/Cl(-) exchange transporter [Treponema sp.]|jgi:H+/Cl- antiporter ClcA|nr:ClC family H(+)/Cl(-) exchange transporter [Treponema sp.]